MCPHMMYWVKKSQLKVYYCILFPSNGIAYYFLICVNYYTNVYALEDVTLVVVVILVVVVVLVVVVTPFVVLSLVVLLAVTLVV